MKIKINDEVLKAIENKIPIVALESTIISHGMPYPENKITALECQRIIRNNDCIPATIAIIKGVITVGLTEDEIDYLGKTGRSVNKVSTRDIPYVVSKGLDGATTVSATSKIASMAGIKVFATGGIGGVHRGVKDTWDISSDLEELAETDICVVCAGAKSILDLNKTMEYLETKKVEVIGYQTNTLPAFYCNSSSVYVNHRLDSPKEIAKLLETKWDLNLQGGVLVTNPIPSEYSMDEKVINKAIDEAIDDMNKEGIIGNKTTPYLLNRIKELTNGDSLKSNIKLVYNNCDLASKIAKELNKLRNTK